MRLVIAPNASMSESAALAAFLLAAVALAVPCAVLLLRGYWPIAMLVEPLPGHVGMHTGRWR